MLLRSFDRQNLQRTMDFRLNGDQGYFMIFSESYSSLLCSLYNGRYDDWDVEAYDRLCHKQDRAYTALGQAGAMTRSSFIILFQRCLNLSRMLVYISLV